MPEKVVFNLHSSDSFDPMAYLREFDANFTIKKVTVETAKQKAHSLVRKIIFNPPATIVFWNDGAHTKTVVKAHNEPFDPEKGLAMAYLKYRLGNKGSYNTVIDEWMDMAEWPNEPIPVVMLCETPNLSLKEDTPHDDEK